MNDFKFRRRMYFVGIIFFSFLLEGMIINVDAFSKDSRRTSSFARKPHLLVKHGRASGTRMVESIPLAAFGIEPITFLHVEP